MLLFTVNLIDLPQIIQRAEILAEEVRVGIVIMSQLGETPFVALDGRVWVAVSAWEMAVIREVRMVLDFLRKDV